MRGRRHKLQVSTFPFLAVLLCAMGSLILVLLVMDRKAHKAAQARARQEAARLAEATARSEADRQAEIERKRQQAKDTWEKKRQELHARLSNEQVEMELQTRKVRDQLSEIAARLRYEQDTSTKLRRKMQDERGKIQVEQQRLGMLRSGAGQVEAQSKESSKTLQRMTSDLLQMEQALKDLKMAKQREQHTFSVVPYHGRRGENRRPIYVECTLTGVIFHPERHAMPLGDAVRTEVERRIARQREKLAGATPYLLLLVRPDGVNTYHEFQAVLKGLDLDFGYEFIDADWVLDFPADDEQPSAQPWMAATTTPAAATSPRVSSRNSGIARPVGMSPSAGPGPPGILSGGAGGSGRWSFRGSAKSVGYTAGGSASGTGGSGPLVLGGGPRGTGSSVPERGMDTGPSGGTSFGPVGSGPVSGGGGERASTGANPWGPNRGGGRGHPSALAPSGGVEEGGRSEPGEEGNSGNGPRGSGAYALRGLTPPYVPGAALPVAPTTPGSEPASLSPPQVLSPGTGALASAGGGNAGAPGAGQPGGNGGFVSGSNLSGTTSDGSSGSGSPGGNFLGSPRTGSGTAGSGSSGRGMQGSSTPGSGSSGATPGSAVSSGVSPQGRYAVASGPEGATGQPGAPGNVSAGAAGGSATNRPGRAEVSPSGGKTPTASGQVSSGPPGAPVQGGAGGAAGQAVGWADAGGPPRPSGGSPSSAHPTQSDAVYPGVDPLMPRRPRGLRPSDRGEEPPPARPTEDAPPDAPRKKVLVQGGGSGEPGDASTGTSNRFATPTYRTARPRKPAGMHPAWVHGGRDWTIYIECLPDGVKLYPSEKTFPLTQAAQGGQNNPLVTAIRQMIDRRQSGRRPDEPPYYPQVRLLVRPENVRTFLTVYPALEALPVPKTRQNLDSDDDVADIVTGARP